MEFTHVRSTVYQNNRNQSDGVAPPPLPHMEGLHSMGYMPPWLHPQPQPPPPIEGLQDMGAMPTWLCRRQPESKKPPPVTVEEIEDRLRDSDLRCQFTSSME